MNYKGLTFERDCSTCLASSINVVWHNVPGTPPVQLFDALRVKTFVSKAEFTSGAFYEFIFWPMQDGGRLMHQVVHHYCAPFRRNFRPQGTWYGSSPSFARYDQSIWASHISFWKVTGKHTTFYKCIFHNHGHPLRETGEVGGACGTFTLVIVHWRISRWVFCFIPHLAEMKHLVYPHTVFKSLCKIAETIVGPKYAMAIYCESAPT